MNAIYIIRNMLNNKTYVGSTINPQQRLTVHKSMLRGGYHDNIHLQRAWDQDGENNFEFAVLDRVKDEVDLIEQEKKYILLFNANGEGGYNFSINTSRTGHYHNEEFRKKQSRSNAKYYGNFDYILAVDKNENEYRFDSLYEAADFILNRGLSKGAHRGVRMNISYNARRITYQKNAKPSKRSFGFRWEYKKL